MNVCAGTHTNTDGVKRYQNTTHTQKRLAAAAADTYIIFRTNVSFVERG